jgi:hypothetical protein
MSTVLIGWLLFLCLPIFIMRLFICVMPGGIVYQLVTNRHQRRRGTVWLVALFAVLVNVRHNSATW